MTARHSKGTFLQEPPGGGLGLVYEIADTIAALRNIDWAELRCPAGFFQSPGWLEFCERRAPGPVRYVISRSKDGEVLGVLPVFLVPVSEAGIYDPAETLGSDDAHFRRLLIAGVFGGYRTGFSIASSAERREAEVMRTMLVAADRLATQLGADCFSLQYLPRNEAALVVQTGLIGPDELILQDCEVGLATAGGSFDDYLATLSAGRRSTVKRDMAAFAAAGMSVEVQRLSDSLDYAPRLFARLKERHGDPLEEREAAEWLKGQVPLLDDVSVVHVARDTEAAPVAYSLSFVWRDMLFVRAVGLDYGRAQPAAAYFEVTYYAPLRYAYAHHLRGVHLGIASLRPKVLRGGRLQELFAVFRQRGGRRLPAAAVAGASARTRGAVAAELGPLLNAPLADFRPAPGAL
jgi:hypothetical protein